MKIVLTELFFSTDANGGADLALNLVPSHVEVEGIPALQWQGRGSCHLYREELQERMEASPATGMGSKDQHPVVPRCHCLPKGTKHLLHQPAEYGRLTSSLDNMQVGESWQHLILWQGWGIEDQLTLLFMKKSIQMQNCVLLLFSICPE